MADYPRCRRNVGVLELLNEAATSHERRERARHERRQPRMLCRLIAVVPALLRRVTAMQRPDRCRGDSRLSVLYKCGEPLLKDSYCAPIYSYGSLQPVPEHSQALFFRASKWKSGL